MQVFINGQWVDHSKAAISIQDILVLRGFGIFDYLRTYGTKSFRLDDHIDRFYNSARHMGMTVKYSKEELSDIIHEGIKRNGFVQTHIKFIQSGGISEDGFLPGGEQTFFAYFYELTEIAPDAYEKGITVATSKLMRQNPEAKTVNYAASIAEVMKVRAQGAVDILHTDTKGNIYEGTRSNFFGVKAGKIITADAGILLGITRKVILEVAEQLDIPVEFRFVHESEIATLDEAFVTSSSMEIMPVTKINDVIIGSGKAGEVTKKLMSRFEEMR